MLTLFLPTERLPSDKQGRQNLSQTLRRLRLTLAQAHPNLPGQTLLTTIQAVMSTPHEALFCDAVVFRQLMEQTADHHHETVLTCTTCLTWLEQAVALYQGDFLADFSLPDAAPFEAWASSLRVQLQGQALDALDTLMAAATRRNDDVALVRHAEQQIAIAPWREDGWQQLLSALIRLKRRNEALQRYHHYRQSLQSELGIQPSFTFRQLVNQVQAEQSAQPEEAASAEQPFVDAIYRGQLEAGGVHDFAISQAGDRLLFVGADGVLRLWDAATASATAQVPRALDEQQTAVTCVALSPNGRLAAVGDASGRIVCWRVADGTTVQAWSAHAGTIHRLTFLPNANALLSVGADGVLQLWELPGGDFEGGNNLRY